MILRSSFMYREIIIGSPVILMILIVIPFYDAQIASNSLLFKEALQFRYKSKKSTWCLIEMQKSHHDVMILWNL